VLPARAQIDDYRVEAQATAQAGAGCAAATDDEQERGLPLSPRTPDNRRSVAAQRRVTLDSLTLRRC
jgi:hypothetical protein